MGRASAIVKNVRLPNLLYSPQKRYGIILKLGKMAEKDNLANRWGCELVVGGSSSSSRTSITDGVKLSAVQSAVMASTHGLYKYNSIHACGSIANQCAVDFATGGDTSSLLIASGSYAAGNGGSLQYLSTSTFTNDQILSIIKSPYDKSMDEKCRAQTVALPYHVPHKGLSERQLRSYEDKCLRQLERVLLVGRLSGKVYKALLLELILSGSGGELSDDFLSKLGHLLTRYNVTVIADEILTGGRVGPSMVISVGLPDAFRACVKYITVGKFLGAGMVVEQSSSQPSEQNGYRGTSTTISLSAVHSKWRTVQERLDQGYIEKRRSKVLQVFGLNSCPDSHWGRGCLIFNCYARHEVQQGLKCRLLPRLDNVGIQKLSTKPKELNRSSICGLLMDTINDWISDRDALFKETQSPFLLAVVDFMLSQEFLSSIADRGFFEIEPDSFLKYAGGDDCIKEMEASWRSIKRRKQAYLTSNNQKKKASSIVQTSLTEIVNSSSPGCFRHSRIGGRNNRRTGYRFFL